MKRIVTVVALSAVAAFATPASATDVGVSVSVSQPGVYGRIDIGRFPQPALVVGQPVLVAPAVMRPQPVYMWVPPGHQKKWAKHCHEYNACGTPVYFVRDEWYQQNVMAARYDGGGRYDDRRGGDRGWDDHPGKGHGKGHGKGRGHD